MEKPTFEGISLSQFTEANLEFIYELTCEEESIYWGGFRTKPDYEKLKSHFANRMADPAKFTQVVLWKNKKVGLVRFEISEDGSCTDYSINISQKFSGLGLGSLALRKSVDYILQHCPACEKLVVWIREDNLRSQKIFRNSGFIETSTCEEVHLGSDRKNISLRKWIKPLAVWEEVFKTQAWGKYPGEDLVRFIARNFYKVPQRAQIKVLEIGCGPGANLWYLAREGFSFVGIDGSAIAISQASKRLDEECNGWRENSELHVGDVSSLPFANETFDAVIDNECVYCNNFENSQRIYGEAHRVLKVDGALFVRTFSAGCWGDGTGQKVGRGTYFCAEGPLAGKGLARFTELDEIPVLLQGFEVLGIEHVARSSNDRKHMIAEWVVHGRKPRTSI